jgi:hypothetical protein
MTTLVVSDQFSGVFGERRGSGQREAELLLETLGARRVAFSTRDGSVVIAEAATPAPAAMADQYPAVSFSLPAGETLPLAIPLVMLAGAGALVNEGFGLDIKRPGLFVEAETSLALAAWARALPGA